MKNNHQKFLYYAQSVVADNLDNPDFNAEDFSRAMFLSRSQLHRKLKALTGKSATEFIRYQRVKKAALLLRNGTSSVSQITFEVGFNNMSYFAKCFKEVFGCKPSAFS